MRKNRLTFKRQMSHTKLLRSYGRSQDFSKGGGGGGHTVSNRGYSSFRNLNIVGLRKKRLTKGGRGESRAP